MRKTLIMLTLALTIGWFNQVRAQNPNDADVIRCHTMESDAMLRTRQPEMGSLDDFEKWLAPLVANIKSEQAANARINAVTTIPIVFHVIHNGDAIGSGDNISTALINAQITQLNNDFRRIAGTSGANNDPVGADTEVEFCAATVDPNGAALTTPGINRIDRNGRGWTAPPYGTCVGNRLDDTYIQNTIKPQSQWDPTRYLNIWVMRLNCNVLGYAQFPSASGLSGLNTNGGAANTDGVVVLPSSIGSTTSPNPNGGNYSRGRTLTHEIGHWVGLRHIWGDGGCSVDDFCNDTPAADGPNFGCNSNATSCGSQDMIENYMDYSDDACMNIFTADQKTRIQAVLQNSPRRGALGNATTCGGGTGGGCATTISSFPYTEGFESGLGAWTQATGDDFDWSPASGSTPSSNTGPTSASEGTSYVYVEASSPNYPSKRTILESPCFDLPASSQTLSFQYHMWGAAMGTLTLEVSTDNGSNWTSIWNRSGDQGNTWTSANVSLASYSGSTIKLRFNALTGSNYTGDIAVDDLKISTGGSTGGGGCTNTVSSFPYTEGFESGFGGWSQATGDDFDWSRTSGSTPSSNTGPSSASEGSFYLYTESSSPNFSTKTAILSSPCFDLSGLSSASFTFKYHMYGAAAMGGLVLEARTGSGAWSSVWSESGNQGNSWKDASVDLSAYAGSTVELRYVGTTGTTWQGDMAIDDVALSSGGSSGGCNTVNIRITFDNYPEETSWQIRSGSTVVASGGTYASQPDGSTINLTECLPDGCYDFVISDSYGDGMCCSYGNGSYLVTNSSNATLASGASFSNSESTNFCVSGGSRIEASINGLEGLNIFPNPVVNNLSYAYQSKVAASALLQVADMTGRIVHLENVDLNEGVNQGKIQVDNLPAGSYMLSISTDDALLTKRFIVTK